MSQHLIIIAAVAYLILLFAVAYLVEHTGGRVSRLTGSSLVYTLSLAVYCSSWTFNGGVGRASQSGLDFLPIYLGPTLAFCLGPIVIRRMLKISHAHRITSIADLIGARFGKSGGLAALVTIIAVIGLVPYIALQLKSISSGFAVLSASGEAADVGTKPVLTDGALWSAIVLTVFAMLFGSRSIHPREHHPGMVVAVALESILKLISLTAIGLFIGYGLFNGFGDLFSKAAAIPDIRSIFAHSPDRYGYNWIAMTLLAMVAVFCLPRQFQIMVVENVDERHLNRALWLFPLYLLAINLFVLPIAIAGRMMLPTDTDPDNLVLAVPLASGYPFVALIAFLGGLSAAASMVVVETTALSLMVCNDVVMPALLRVKALGLERKADLTSLLLWVRRLVMIGVMGLGYLYMRHDSAQFALVSIGLMSFVAVAQFAPAIIAGLFWRGATKAGAFAGISTGFLVWVYTLLFPSFARSGALTMDFIAHGPFGIALLKPYALFGLQGLDPVTHSTFWSLIANVGCFVGVSLAGRQSPVERAHAAMFVEAVHPGDAAQIWRRTALIPDLMSLASRFLGREKAASAYAEWAAKRGLDARTVVQADTQTVLFYERLLAGVIGAASARVLVDAIVEEEPLGVDEIMRILDETSRVIEANRQLEEKSRALEAATAELKEANDRLQLLDRLKDDFVATVNHELRTPLSSIRAFSEILRDHPDLTLGERHEFLRIVITESERLTRLINQLLDLSKIEASGTVPRADVPVDLATIARESAAALDQVFATNGVALHLEIETPSALVLGDHDRLVQVLINLLGNAAKFALPGSGRAHLTLSRTGNAFELAVGDNGPGIRQKDRKVVFERFRQLGDTMNDKPHGAGLGLAISQRIVMQHGGRIWIEESRFGGALFKVSLPCAPSKGRRAKAKALQNAAVS
ncbi:MAG TPA: ATP-binding protein [Rhizobiaceae bacterium]|nr:ATP-binding protein [Rhizobiaceae bacterium]